MRDITNLVDNSKGYEFLWGAPQSVLVVFKNGDFVTSFTLKENTSKEAVMVSKNFLSKKTLIK